jgi:hypothetical protein
MIGFAVKTMGLTAAAAVIIAYVAAPGAKHHAAGPNDPIAADGSLAAGRARTIYDSRLEFSDPAARNPNSDDPADFAPLIERERPFADRDRSLFKSLLGARLDWSICKNSRGLLVAAVHAYYGERGREIKQFSRRGPHAKAAIEAEWSTAADREIDDYVRHALQYGIVRNSDAPANVYPEFARMFADVEPLGSGCSTADDR